MTEHLRSSNSGRGRPPRRLDPEGLRELRQEVRELRRGNAPREPRRPRQPSAARRLEFRDPVPRSAPLARARRRRRLIIPAALVLIALVLILERASGPARSFPLPSRASLAGMGVGQRIVAIAGSQVGYSADPAHSYCNKFSAYWGAGTPSCPAGKSAEEWCADFAAWAWRTAGVPFGYGFYADEINASAASFYAWGVAHGTWHSAYGDYRPQPGDVAVYGLSLGTSPTAAHVAVVTGAPSGQRGPDVINGDGDRTGFSVVETGSDQLRADTGHGGGAPLAGYVSPD